MENLARIISRIGLSEKAAQVYLANLELGEATILQLADQAKLKRTSVYYSIEELEQVGAVAKTKRNKKIYYLPTPPEKFVTAARERLREVEDILPLLVARERTAYPGPRVYFLYGPVGFKQAWDKVLTSGDKEFRIITEAFNFNDFVKEKYILDHIISQKKRLGIKSKQLITDSPIARKIIARDNRENRQSKILPPGYKLPFTEIVCNEFVVLISPRFDNLLLIIDDIAFARTRHAVFEIIWQAIK